MIQKYFYDSQCMHALSVLDKICDTAGKISIEHVTIFLSKNISKGAIDMKFSPDVGNNPSNPYIQRKQIK